MNAQTTREMQKAYYGWPLDGIPPKTRQRAAKVIRFLMAGDEYIAKKCREYDNCLEMGDGAGVVNLVKIAANANFSIKLRVLSSRFASKDWIF